MQYNNDKPLTFVCCGCGETHLARFASKGTQALYPNIVDAIVHHDCLCQRCEEADRQFVSEVWPTVAPIPDSLFGRGRSQTEEFELCGCTIELARWQAHCLSN